MKTKYKKTQSHCVASVSARVRREQLDQSEKKGWKEEGEGESASQVTLTREGITSQSSVLACVKGGGGSPLCQFLVRDFMSFLETEGKNTIYWAKSPVNILLLTTLKHYHTVTNDRTYKINTIA